MPGFSVNEFKSSLGQRGGPARFNKWLMTFTLPRIIYGDSDAIFENTQIVRDVEFWCESVNLPGYQLATNTARRWGYGPDEKRPYAPIYQPLQATFICDAEMGMLNFFNGWMQYIMPHDWYNAGLNASFSSFGGGAQYHVEYKSLYATDITIQQYDPAGRLKLRYFVKEAFPSQVVDIGLNWNDPSYGKFQVMFDYLDWVSDPSIKLLPENNE